MLLDKHLAVCHDELGMENPVQNAPQSTADRPLAEAPVAAAAPSGGFPPISVLFRESWHEFTHSIVWLIVLTIASWIAIFAVALVAFLVGLASGLGAFLSSQGGGNLGAVFGSSLGIVLVLAIVFFVVSLIVIGFVMQIGSVLIIASDKQQFSFGGVVRKSIGLILPLFITQFIVGLLAIGGFFVFVLPAIIFGYLFMFTMYVVIFESHRGTSALRRSMTLATHHFGEVFARFLVFIGLAILFYLVYFFVSFFVGLLLGISSVAAKEAAAGALGMQLVLYIIMQIVSTLSGWYILAYLYTLYKHASANTPAEKKASMRWVWGVAAVGWIIAILVTSFAISAIGNSVNSGALQKALQEAAKEGQQGESNLLDERLLYPTESPLQTY